ncbi:metabolite traffic protein EboE [Microbacterium sp. VKM Ac-2923]|uniref:metabolite traffic protein EboE n=1 Tax=Microbacterium sp. VKM Ac-2923 TaxID=2929476 RepID=UPI001FB34DA0|nr:metabolite traffic protein EboE [Microbacterium sp. VKM Ac-2923]MCJ1709099.1 metabolite traffic protein EboE [Microbacterium sp. VKM Ac-2923]
MHLSYCTNVHPAEDLAGIVGQLDEHAGPVRREAGLDRLGVGLWMPVGVASVLAGDAGARETLAAALERNGLELRTVNAFPYRGFHDDVVKLAVYRPDWTTPERLSYTLDCARALAALLPDGAEGSISTLPLGWREGWDATASRAAEENLARLVAGLGALERETGRTVRVGIEPEPGCILDDVADVVAWLGARPALIADGLLGLCLDTCHLAVSFADPGAVVAAATAAGVRIVKVQASVALEVPTPSNPRTIAALQPFAEERYVHQVRSAHGTHAADDLPEVLDAHEPWPADQPWRVHVHIPLHARPAAPLRATTEVLLAAVDAVLAAPGGDEAHLDVETYTWSVLPASLQPATLVDGIAAELRWVREHLPHALTGTDPDAAPGGAVASGVDRAPTPAPENTRSARDHAFVLATHVGSRHDRVMSAGLTADLPAEDGRSLV